MGHGIFCLWRTRCLHSMCCRVSMFSSELVRERGEVPTAPCPSRMPCWAGRNCPLPLPLCRVVSCQINISYPTSRPNGVRVTAVAGPAHQL